MNLFGSYCPTIARYVFPEPHGAVIKFNTPVLNKFKSTDSDKYFLPNIATIATFLYFNFATVKNENRRAVVAITAHLFYIKRQSL